MLIFGQGGVLVFGQGGAPPVRRGELRFNIINRIVLVIFCNGLAVAVKLARAHVGRVAPAAAAEAGVNWFIGSGLALFNNLALVGAVSFGAVSFGAVNVFCCGATLLGGVAEAPAAGSPQATPVAQVEISEDRLISSPVMTLIVNRFLQVDPVNALIENRYLPVTQSDRGNQRNRRIHDQAPAHQKAHDKR